MVLLTEGLRKGPADVIGTVHRALVGLESSDLVVMVAKVTKMAAAAEEDSKVTILQAEIVVNAVAPGIALEALTERIKKSSFLRACVTKYLWED